MVAVLQLERAATEHPDASLEERGQAVCLYLGNALARKQFGSFKALGTSPLVKVSFVPYPPGTPASLALGRVEYKLKDSKSSNTSTPPWAGFGSLCRKGNEWDFSVLSVRQYREQDGIRARRAVATSQFGTCNFGVAVAEKSLAEMVA